MSRTSLATLVLLASLASSARGQYVGPGSTPQGDILRGEGVAAWGAGMYNYYTAMGDSINADTLIRVNEYVVGAAKNENRLNAIHAREESAKHKKAYQEVQDRIENNPELYDIRRGDALNAKMKQLLQSGSLVRFARATLPADTVRRIPFAFPEQNATFSMQRLSPKGRGKWPVAFQDEQFARERRAYERAFDAAMDQIDGKQSLSAIKDVEDALRDLSVKLERVIGPQQHKLFNEATNYLKRLEKAKELLKLHQIQKILVEIDSYSGTTLGELMEFMNRNHLRFDVPDVGEETQLYRGLYAIMEQELAGLTGEPKSR